MQLNNKLILFIALAAGVYWVSLDRAPAPTPPVTQNVISETLGLYADYLEKGLYSKDITSIEQVYKTINNALLVVKLDGLSEEDKQAALKVLNAIKAEMGSVTDLTDDDRAKVASIIRANL